VSWFNKFRVAVEGIRQGLGNRSIVVQILLGLITLIFFGWLQISYVEWLVVLVLISLVIVTEWANTVVEEVIDFISLEYSPQAKKIKDLSAGMVLISCIMAVIVGLMIVVRHLGGFL
jgi:undecaprenol kinase